MKKIKVGVVCCEQEFISHSLIPAVIQCIADVDFVADFRGADIVICAPFSIFEHVGVIDKLKFRGKLKISQEWADKNIRDKFDPCKKQIWLHYSGESPSIGKNASFLNSGCDFGIGHEVISNKRYFRFPLWHGSLDWKHEGVVRGAGSFTRFGQPIAVSKVMSGISSKEWNKRNFSCALVSSHTRSPRDIILDTLDGYISVKTYGLLGTGVNQFKSNTTKLKIYSGHALALCPENQVYPGYITEKVLEAFAGGCLAVGWYHKAQKDFCTESHINLFTGDERFSMDQLQAVIDEKISLIRTDGIPPLLAIRPTLDGLKNFLLNIINQCR